MKKMILMTVVAVYTALASGCATGKPNFAKAVNEVIGAATGPCAADLVKAAATCKKQYPQLPW